MSNVYPFRQRPVRGALPPLAERPRYHCKRCDTSMFHILDDGSVACFACHSHVCNLRVIDSTKGER